MLIFELVFGLLGLLATIFIRTLSALSPRHLKEEGNLLAKRKLRLLDNYGEIRALLEIVRLLCVVLFVMQIATHYSSITSFFILLLYLTASYYFVEAKPKEYQRRLLMRIARMSKKTLVVVRPSVKPLAAYYAKKFATDNALYVSKGDILAICADDQQELSNLTEAERTVISNLFESANLKIKDMMIPKRKVYSVSIEDKLTPVVLDELYKKEVSHFLVLENQQPVGVLETRLLSSAKSNSSVLDVCKRDICYVNEEQSIEEILDAFYTTKQYLYVVIDTNQVVKGIVTMTDVLKKILGQPPLSSFDQYHDKLLVASIRSQHS